MDLERRRDGGHRVECDLKRATGWKQVAAASRRPGCRGRGSKKLVQVRVEVVHERASRYAGRSGRTRQTGGKIRVSSRQSSVGRERGGEGTGVEGWMDGRMQQQL